MSWLSVFDLVACVVLLAFGAAFWRQKERGMAVVLFVIGLGFGGIFVAGTYSTAEAALSPNATTTKGSNAPGGGE